MLPVRVVMAMMVSVVMMMVVRVHLVFRAPGRRVIPVFLEIAAL